MRSAARLHTLCDYVTVGHEETAIEWAKSRDFGPLSKYLRKVLHCACSVNAEEFKAIVQPYSTDGMLEVFPALTQGRRGS